MKVNHIYDKTRTLIIVSVQYFRILQEKAKQWTFYYDVVLCLCAILYVLLRRMVATIWHQQAANQKQRYKWPL